MSLSDIFCQDRAIGTLERAFASGRVPHAYIFAGPEGVGKFTTASQWARLLLCQNPAFRDGFADGCGKCRSCRLFDAGSHPDFAHVYKELREFTEDGKGKIAPHDVPIDVIREFLLEKVPIRPTVHTRKVFVVSEAEKLNIQAQNAMLKTLEEPPAYCCIILLCTRPEDLLPTIRSRCQILRFSPVGKEKIAEKLMRMGLDEQKSRYFAHLCDGGLGPACIWAGLELAGAGLYRSKQELVRSITAYKYAESLDLADSLIETGKDIASSWVKLDNTTSKADITRRAQKTVIRIVISVFRDAMKLGLPGSGEIINFDQKELIKKMADLYPPEQTGGKITACYEAVKKIDASVNEKLIFEQLLLNLAFSDSIRV